MAQKKERFAALSLKQLGVNVTVGGIPVQQIFIAGGVAPYDIRLAVLDVEDAASKAILEWVGEDGVALADIPAKPRPPFDDPDR